VVGIKLYVHLDAEYTQITSIYGVYIKETEKVVACIRGTVRRICKAISILDRSKSWSMNLATFCNYIEDDIILCPPHTPLAEEIQIKRRWRLKAVAHTERDAIIANARVPLFDRACMSLYFLLSHVLVASWSTHLLACFVGAGRQWRSDVEHPVHVDLAHVCNTFLPRYDSLILNSLFLYKKSQIS
jgi:hypothetical protein